MLSESMSFLSNECLPEVFKSYGGWSASMCLLGVFVSNAIQLTITNFSRNTQDKKSAIFEDTKSSIYVLEAGVIAHSILVGVALGTISGEVYHFKLVIYNNRA